MEVCIKEGQGGKRVEALSIFGLFFSLFFLIIPFVIGYLVIRLAVRHAIDSSETGRIIKEMYENNTLNKQGDDDRGF